MPCKFAKACLETEDGSALPVDELCALAFDSIFNVFLGKRMKYLERGLFRLKSLRDVSKVDGILVFEALVVSFDRACSAYNVERRGKFEVEDARFTEFFFDEINEWVDAFPAYNN